MINIISDVLFFVSLIVCVVSSVLQTKNEKNKIDLNIEKHGNKIFVVIFLLATILLTYKIQFIPNGLHVDEGGAFYDAYCIGNYGVDRYLNKFPVYLINFGGGQSALYAYFAGILMKIFGNTIFVFRLPAVILSLISLICLYRLIEKNNNKEEALLSSFILMISPWFIMKSRWGLDCNLMSSMLIIAICSFVKAVESKKSYCFLVSGLLFGLTLYTYAISYMVLPIILAILIIYFYIIKKINIKNIVIMAVPLGILAVPLMLMIAMNSGIIGNIKIPFFTIPKLWFYRGGEVSLKNIPENIKNIFEILFIKDFLNYNSVEMFGTLYKMSIPIVIFGLIISTKNAIQQVKQKTYNLDLIMVCAFLISLFVALCISELNINKINFIYIFMVYFAGRFVYYVAEKKWYLSIVVAVSYCIIFVMFINYYFNDFVKEDLMYFENDIIDASEYAEELQSDKIYIENCLNQTYIYTLVENKMSPYKFNENLKIDNGNVVSYNKYEFDIPIEVENNAVYIIKNDKNKINELLDSGFEIKEFGEFKVLFKN